MTMKRVVGIAAAATAAAWGAAGLAADWGELENGGAPVASASQPAAVWVTPTRAVVAGIRSYGGTDRVFAWQREAGNWTALGGGLPVDGANGEPHRRPVLAADGLGRAVLLQIRYAGTGWRLHARLFDGAGFTDLNEGAPVDAGAPGNVAAAAAAFATPSLLVAAYTQYVDGRMAVFASLWNGSEWTVANGGQPLDLPEAGSSDGPAVAPDGRGGAVVTYVQPYEGRARLFAVRYANGEWTRMDGGAPVDPETGGSVLSPQAVALPDGRVVVAYLAEDPATWVTRVRAVVWNGAGWQPVNGGAWLDESPMGVAVLAAAATGDGAAVVAYVTQDQLTWTEPGAVRAIRISGLSSVPIDSGASLGPSGQWLITGLALAGSGTGGGGTALLLVTTVDAAGDAIYARTATLAPAAAAAPASGAEGLAVVGNVFRPVRGERMTARWTVASPQRVRVTVHGLAGGAVRTIADGGASGTAEGAWDGRDDAGRPVPAGVYLVVAKGETFRATAKAVVVR